METEGDTNQQYEENLDCIYNFLILNIAWSNRSCSDVDSQESNDDSCDRESQWSYDEEKDQAERIR